MLLAAAYICKMLQYCTRKAEELHVGGHTFTHLLDSVQLFSCLNPDVFHNFLHLWWILVMQKYSTQTSTTVCMYTGTTDCETQGRSWITSQTQQHCCLKHTHTHTQEKKGKEEQDGVWFVERGGYAIALRGERKCESPHVFLVCWGGGLSENERPEQTH